MIRPDHLARPDEELLLPDRGREACQRPQEPDGGHLEHFQVAERIDDRDDGPGAPVAEQATLAGGQVALRRAEDVR